MEINKDDVGFRISNIRKRLGLNQELFGQKINLAHKSLVSKWEKGQSLPNNERLKMIAELGGISVDELLYGSTWEYAKRKISDICLKFHISDAYFYMIFNKYIPAVKDQFQHEHPKEVVINNFIFSFGGGSVNDLQLSYEMIDSQEFEDAFLTEIGFDKGMQNTSLKDKVNQYVHEIMTVEIQEFYNIKYKELYDEAIKEDAIRYMLTKYSFGSLTDIGIKSRTRELLEIYLDRKALRKQYDNPFNDVNAVEFTSNVYDKSFKRTIDDYFLQEELPYMGRGFLQEEELKPELSYELYEKLIHIFEKTNDDLDRLLNQYKK